MIEGILTGVLGNGAYNFLEKLIKKYFIQEDEEVIQLFITAINTVSADFFDKYVEDYGTKESSFLSVEKNWELLVQSIFYGSKELREDDFVLNGIGIEKAKILIGVRKFIDMLQLEIKKSWKLDKVLSEKKHITDSEKNHKELKEKLSFLEELITGLVTNNQASTKEKKVEPNIVTGLNSESFEFGKKYKIQIESGASINYMLTNELAYVEYIFEDGATAYYEVDYSGSVRDSKFPYPLEEYQINFSEKSLIERKIMNLPNGNLQEIMRFRWGKYLSIIKNSQGRVLNMDAQCRIEVDHRNKKITIMEE